jgi:hypothetical protein
MEDKAVGNKRHLFLLPLCHSTSMPLLALPFLFLCFSLSPSLIFGIVLTISYLNPSSDKDKNELLPWVNSFWLTIEFQNKH